MSQSSKVQGALAFLSAFIPQLTPVLAVAPQVIGMAKKAFTKVGGTDADLDRILTENDIDIDKLANPDQFFEPRPAATPGAADPAASIYGHVIDTITSLSFRRGDEIYASPDRSHFFVVRGAYETSPLVPVGYTLYGRFDGAKVVLAEG